MADIKISQLGAASTLTGSEAFPESNNGVTYKATANQIKEFAIGSTSIAGIGDGTPTGAISALNTALGNKVEKTDITSILQTGTTATQSILKGKYFYLNGTLVKAKTDISNGATFTLNTNYEEVSEGAINELSDRLIANKFGTGVPLNDYSDSDHLFTAPSDGYVILRADTDGSTTRASLRCHLYSADMTQFIAFDCNSVTMPGGDARTITYVKKGMKMFVTHSGAANYFETFMPIQ